MNKIQQPETQKWLTNTITVQYNVNGQNFEIACYANKVRSYKSGVEKNIDEVLQTDTIFSDMIQGEIINNKTLMDVFQTTDKRTICEIILQKGRVQLTEQERLAEQNRTIKEIVAIITQRTFNPVTKITYPPQIIEDAIKNQLHYSPNNFPVSEQAAMLIKQLQQITPLQIKPVSVYLEILDSAGVDNIPGLIKDNNIEILDVQQEECLITFDTMNENVPEIKKILQMQKIQFQLNVQKTFRVGQ